jgi:hypothetical protein
MLTDRRGTMDTAQANHANSRVGLAGRYRWPIPLTLWFIDAIVRLQRGNFC